MIQCKLLDHAKSTLLYHKCAKCDALQIQNITEFMTLLRERVCWQCFEHQPLIYSIVQNREGRIKYHLTGFVPAPMVSGIF